MSTIPQDTNTVALFSRVEAGSPKPAAFIFTGFYSLGYNVSGPIPGIDVEGSHRTHQEVTSSIARDGSVSPKMAAISWAAAEAIVHVTDEVVCGKTAHSRESDSNQKHRGGIAG